MQLDRKIEVLSQLGEHFQALVSTDKINGNIPADSLITEGKDIMENVHHHNGWFTPDSVKMAVGAWSESLKPNKLKSWLESYELASDTKKIGVIMAGNIPLVGLHDAICVLLSDHQLVAKLSSKDQLLMKYVFKVIAQLSEEWSKNITVSDSLKGVDALIATGSDNSSRYFEYYFRDKKKLLRKNRTSVAVLNGTESDDDLNGLADDVFTHFGLGCRNVTKVYLPKDFDTDRMFNAFFKYKDIAEHNKYANNYDYNKAVYLLNQIELIENGFLLLKQDEGLHSPVGVLFYERYNDLASIEETLEAKAEEIQCVVSNLKNRNHVKFGKAQQPELWDYADGVDTLKFLNE